MASSGGVPITGGGNKGAGGNKGGQGGGGNKGGGQGGGRGGGGNKGGGNKGGGNRGQGGGNRGRGNNPFIAPGIRLHNPLLSGATLLGHPRQMLRAAQAIVNLQTAGPLADLAKQIALNNQQSTAAQKVAAGDFNQFGQLANQGAAQQQQIAAGLNTQLAGIGQQQQQQLTDIGNQGHLVLAAYTPQGQPGSAATTSSAAQQSLAAEMARQQGLAAQASGAFRGYGAIQGANTATLGAQQAGVGQLRGQEAIKSIGQGTAAANVPLQQKRADVIASKGPLLTTSIGQLTQAERNYQVAKSGLNIKNRAITATIQQNKAQNKIDWARIKSSDAQVAARLLQQNTDSIRSADTSRANAKTRAQTAAADRQVRQSTARADRATRIMIAKMQHNASQNKPATNAQRNALFSHIDYLTSQINQLMNYGFSKDQAYHIVQNGHQHLQIGTAGGKPVFKNYYPNRVGTQRLNAAFNVRNGGSGLSPGDLAWLKSMGIPNETRYRKSPGTVGGAVSNAGGGHRNLF